MQHHQDVANIHWAHGNCVGFSKYKEFLPKWLGNKPWDIIQFNIGHWNLRMDIDEYRSELTDIFDRLQVLAPKADIVFALTTPSPFDSPTINISKSTCPNGVYDKLAPKGNAQKLNEIAIDVVQSYNKNDTTTTTSVFHINDRYNLVLPELQKYQWECNIHFSDYGYDYIAKHDWDFAIDILKKREERAAGAAAATRYQ